MSTTFTCFTTLLQMICPSCGGIYAIAQEYKNEAQMLGEFKKCWTCPYCKTERGYGEGEADRLRAQITTLTNDRDFYKRRHDEAQNEAEHFRRSRNVTRGHLTRIKKRVSCGVCPCCNRSFENLRRHMASQHPGFQTEESA